MSIDINRRYRDCAVFCVVHANKHPFGRIEWSKLIERYGHSWETYTHELMVKGILHGSAGYFYLSNNWKGLNNQEAIKEINKIYPR